jgi:hypothetical protein
MLYILHHAKGALMIEAQDKNQVLKWSERQLGLQARLVSVSEAEISDTDNYVEKGGTGITAREAEVCQPVRSIMANIFANASDAEEFHMESELYKSGPRLTGRMPTVH